MIPILYEDEALVVVDKPPGLVVEPSPSQLGQKTLVDFLEVSLRGRTELTRAERMGLAHRLDMDTSGVLVVAKNFPVLDSLQRQFRLRQVSKEYRALVHGSVTTDGKVHTLVGRNPRSSHKFMAQEISPRRHHPSRVIPKAREAESNYSVSRHLFLEVEKLLPQLGRLTHHQKSYYQTHAKDYSLLSVFPSTGRTHQIRVQLKYMGFPIVADQLYGPRKLLKLDLLWCERQFLHAYKLGFSHPLTHEIMEVVSPLPDDLLHALSRLAEQQIETANG